MPELASHPSPALRLRPFPAMRFNPDIVADIGAATCPPYDVMDRAMIDALLSSHPQNIVRLILPRLVHEPLGADDPYATAAKRLERWRRDRVFVTAEQPALYVYEYGDSGHRVCGVVGALELGKRTRAAVLPHEGVIPAIVADRLAMVVASRANLEPILLVYDGGGAIGADLAAARRLPALIDVTAADGTFHRLWPIADEVTLRRIRKALQPQVALIADGHHRYSSYLQLRHRHRSIGDGAGPWDRGLALLIDQSEFPLQIGAIHRSVSELSLGALRMPAGFESGAPRPLTAGLPSPPGRPGEVVLSDGIVEQTVRLPLDGRTSVTDVELVHEVLLPALGVTEDRIGYHHTVLQTMHSCEQEDGLAILLHPSTVAAVTAVARAGKMMPRKSTSFGPKPRNGLVMRAFSDEA